MNKSNQGFSLIEMIIVIAIMAVLIALITPNLVKYLYSSKEQTDKKNLDEVRAEITAAIADAMAKNITIISGEDGNVKATYTVAEDISTGDVKASPTLNGTDEFATLITQVLKDGTSRSKKNSKLDKIEIVISGCASQGYELKVNFIS